ncbi:MAG: hypothetical protein IPN15_10630 [Saprospiraceae bacterium]|nr:hypothetical protein [Candidatus Vicinibacter affinis]
MGFQYSMIGDQRESKTKIHSAGCNINNDNITIPPLLPIAPFLTVFPFYSMEDTKFRSIVLTKHIQQTGILDYTISYDLGSTVETRNLVWDGITGEVLATQTFNEFEDPIYNFSYPAHWAYKGMGPAYKNINAVFKASTINSNNEITISSNDFFQEGDEVLLNGDTKAWVKTKVSNDKIIFN